jgi:hypothetical protein
MKPVPAPVPADGENQRFVKISHQNSACSTHLLLQSHKDKPQIHCIDPGKERQWRLTHSAMTRTTQRHEISETIPPFPSPDFKFLWRFFNPKNQKLKENPRKPKKVMEKERKTKLT